MVFISGNMPMKTEIAPLLIVTKLEQYDYAGATAIAVVMLLASFVLLLLHQPAAAPRRAGHARRLTMAARSPTAARGTRRAERHAALGEPRCVRWLLIGIALAFLGLFLVLPLVASVFAEALRKGVGAYLAAHQRAGRRSRAIRLTLLTAGDRRAAEPGVRPRRGLGDRQVPSSAARAC